MAAVSMENSVAQIAGEAAVRAFQDDLGPFVVAAQRTRMPMIFTDADPDHAILFVNDAFLQLTGFARDYVLGAKFQSLLAPGADPEVRSIVEAAFGEEGTKPEVHYRRENGSEFWASLFVSPVCNDAGEPVQYFVSIHDLTEHRREIAQSKALIDELNHRVKNTLSTVQSIVAQALRRPATPEVIRESIESRILALSRSHDLLTSSNWEGAGLHDLVVTALHPFEVVAGHAERFTITGENMDLSPKATLALAVALHELATNAVKYGAFSNNEGRIEISWISEPDAEGDKLVLCWLEHDGPLVKVPAHKGFGSWVIERGLAHELGGAVMLDYREQGVVCTIHIPATARVGG
jgi:PAS domain S-box-containing protein